MEVLRAFFALLAGFATMALLVALVHAMLANTFPQWVESPGRPGAGYVAVNLTYSFLAAGAGGYVTAWMGSQNPLHTVLTLAIVVLVLGALSALQARGKQPAWYQVALLILSTMGVMAGGLLRLKLTGML